MAKPNLLVPAETDVDPSRFLRCISVLVWNSNKRDAPAILCVFGVFRLAVDHASASTRLSLGDCQIVGRVSVSCQACYGLQPGQVTFLVDQLTSSHSLESSPWVLKTCVFLFCLSFQAWTTISRVTMCMLVVATMGAAWPELAIYESVFLPATTPLYRLDSFFPRVLEPVAAKTTNYGLWPMARLSASEISSVWTTTRALKMFTCMSAMVATIRSLFALFFDRFSSCCNYVYSLWPWLFGRFVCSVVSWDVNARKSKVCVETAKHLRKWYWDEDTAQLRSEYDHRCLDVNMQGSNNIYIHPCHSGNNQKFETRRVGAQV